MTDYYVDSTDGGTDAGTEANPWTSLFSAVSIAAGDRVLVADVHDELYAGTSRLDFTNATEASPVQVISVDFDNSYAYLPGAKFSVAADSSQHYTDIGPRIEWWGVDIDHTGNTGSSDVYIGYTGLSSDKTTRIFDTTFTYNDRFWVGYIEVFTEFTNCTFVHNTSGSEAISLNGRADSVTFNNCTFSGGAGASSVLTWVGSQPGVTVIFNDCDLSAFSTICTGLVDHSFRIIFNRCKVAASTDFFSGTWVTNSSGYIQATQCDDGTDIGTTPLGLTHYETITGEITSLATPYRTNGADDGEQANEYSWKMVSTSSTITGQKSLKTPPLVRWVEGGAELTATIYVAGGTTLNNDELWMEISGPDEAAAETAQGYFMTTRPEASGTWPTGNPQASGTNIAPDGASTWNGAGVGTKQKMSVTYTPTLAGPLTVIACLSKPTTTVYIDPKVEIS